MEVTVNPNSLEDDTAALGEHQLKLLMQTSFTNG